MYTVSKLNKQNEQTWVNLQRRLNCIQFSYSKLFTNDEVHHFVKNKAVSVGSSEGHFIPNLLTTTAFILACNDARVDPSTHRQPLNLFTIFVGYPGTGEYIIYVYLVLPSLYQHFPIFFLRSATSYMAMIEIWLVFQTHSI